MNCCNSAVHYCTEIWYSLVHRPMIEVKNKWAALSGNAALIVTLSSYYMCQGGYVLSCVCLSVCLPVGNYYGSNEDLRDCLPEMCFGQESPPLNCGSRPHPWRRSALAGCSLVTVIVIRTKLQATFVIIVHCICISNGYNAPMCTCALDTR